MEIYPDAGRKGIIKHHTEIRLNIQSIISIIYFIIGIVEKYFQILSVLKKICRKFNVRLVLKSLMLVKCERLQIY